MSLFLPLHAVCLQPLPLLHPVAEGVPRQVAGAASMGVTMARHDLLSATTIFAGLLASSLASRASAGEAATTTSFSVDRTYTTNALDRVEALPDWSTTSRAGATLAAGVAGAALRLGLDVEHTAHDRYAIEDDTALRLSLGAEKAVSPKLALAGEAALSLASEGDDIEVGQAILGIRTQTLAGAVALKAGYALSERSQLAGEISVARSDPGLAMFEAGLVEPQQLSPRRDTLGAGLRFTHRGAAATYVAAAGAELRLVGEPGRPPYDFRFGHQFLRGEIAAERGSLSMAAGLGADRLASANGGFDIVRPSLAASLAYTHEGGTMVRGSASAGLDLSGARDPLAAWVRKVELDATVPAGRRLKLNAGAYASRSEYLLLGYEEDAYGAFAGAALALGHGFTLGAELGAHRRLPLDGGPPIDALDASVSLAVALPHDGKASATIR